MNARTISINAAWLATIESLCQKAEPAELYVLHGMLLFQHTVYSATGGENARFNIRRAESVLIDAVRAKGGYPKDNSVLRALQLSADGAQ